MSTVAHSKERAVSLPKVKDRRWSSAVVLAAAALMFFLRLGSRALWSSEGRWAEITREMLLTGKYFWPTINGRLYFDKPLLSYWFIAALAKPLGAVSETAARIPSALAGLLGVGLIIMLGRRLYDRTTANLAGFILATCYSYVFFSRTASADMETLTGVLAVIVLFEVCHRQPGGWWVIGLWPLMAVTSLTKGLIGFALPIVVIGCYSLLEEGSGALWEQLRGPFSKALRWAIAREAWFFNWKTPLAILLGGLIYGLPFAASEQHNHSAAGLYMVFRENIVRYFAPFDHRGPIYLYVGVIFALMVPWSVLLPAALIERHRHPHSDLNASGIKPDLLSLTYFWATFAFFTLSRSRRSYYLLPILPPAALLIARTLCERREALWRPARRLMDVGYGLLVIGVIGGGVAYLLPPRMRLGNLRLMPPSPHIVVFAVLWIACLVGIWRALIAISNMKVALSTGLVAYAGLAFLFLLAMPAAEPYRTERPFAQAVRTATGDDLQRLALYRLWGPGLVYYLHAAQPMGQFTDPAALTHYAHDRGEMWVITRGRDAGSLPGAKVVIKEPLMRWDPPSEARNRYLLLELH